MAENIIPQSDALAEASPQSLSELFSRDPEGFQKRDLSTLVAELRKQRERFKAAEAAGKPAKEKKVVATSTKMTLGDLGL